MGRAAYTDGVFEGQALSRPEGDPAVEMGFATLTPPAGAKRAPHRTPGHGVHMNDVTRSHLPPAAASLSLAVAARGLVKRFGDVRAVDGLDLEVPRGMIFAILGPNGAGKTTLMRMLATLTTPDSGSAAVLGHDIVAAPHEVRAVIAMTGQFASLDEDLTGRENLLLLARLWGFRGRKARIRADELLAAFDLSDAATKQVKAYSGGMRRRRACSFSTSRRPASIRMRVKVFGG
jgi:ABC-type polysaccharide/polyol phosphate transport system ATPase subunit